MDWTWGLGLAGQSSAVSSVLWLIFMALYPVPRVMLALDEQ